MPDDVIVNQSISNKSSVKLLKDGEKDLLKDSFKPKEGFNYDNVSNVLPKAADDSSEKDTDMAGRESKSSNPLDFDVAMSNPELLIRVLFQLRPPNIFLKRVVSDSEVVPTLRWLI